MSLLSPWHEIHREAPHGGVALLNACLSVLVRAALGGDGPRSLPHKKKHPKLHAKKSRCVLGLKLDSLSAGALEDLNKAIELSRSQGKSACQAHTQRGLIQRLQGKIPSCHIFTSHSNKIAYQRRFHASSNRGRGNLVLSATTTEG